MVRRTRLVNEMVTEVRSEAQLLESSRMMKNGQELQSVAVGGQTRSPSPGAADGHWRRQENRQTNR